MRVNIVVAATILAKLTTSTPIEHQMSSANVRQVAQNAHGIDLQVLNKFIGSNACQNQSCALGDISGSSGLKPKYRPEGADDSDIKCIAKYNPQVMEWIKENIPNGPKQDTGISSKFFEWLSGIWKQYVKTPDRDTGNFTGNCTKNILMISKGTMEPMEYGVTVGPQLKTGWDSTWSTVPVDYDPSVPADYCVGLPGGFVVKDMINQAAQKCPDSKLFVAGYSQGAMVVRNGVAYADASAKSHVKGVLTFGDPFQGSPIKGYSGPIKTFCKVNDGVCGGNFELSGAHLSYPFDSSINEAKDELKKWAAAA